MWLITVKVLSGGRAGRCEFVLGCVPLIGPALQTAGHAGLGGHVRKSDWT